MNVNQQSNDNVNQSLVRRELRERKIMTNYQDIDQVKPFRSFRKGKQAQIGEASKNIEAKLGGQIKSSPVKLKYEYPLHDTFQNKGEKSPAKSKYKYDISGKVDQNQLSLNYNSRKMNFQKPETFQHSKVSEQLIKKNVNRLNIPFGFGSGSPRRQVQSIIFDSKVSKRSRPEGLDDKQVRQFSVSVEMAEDKKYQNFQQKVNKVNSQIEAGLTNLQQMIQKLKKKKNQESQIKFKEKATSRIQKLEQQFAERRAQTLKKRQQQQIKRKQQEEQLQKRMKERNQQKQEQQRRNKVEQLIKKQKKIQKNIQKALSPQKNEVTQSLIQLQGDFKNKGQLFPPQYTSFINRLALQIEKDIQFTNNINNLTKSNHIQHIRTLIFQQIKKHQDIVIDTTFFSIEQMEMDPLDQAKPAWYKKYSEEQLEQEALNVFKQYQSIENNFKNKLEHKFQTSVINLLFEELTKFNFTKNSPTDTTCITVGHLLSYLNMRTNRSFRNRSFIKMLKRFNLKHNSYLNANTLERIVKN